MDNERVYQRRASANEQRTISREDIGFYHAVIVGSVYDFGGSTSESNRTSSPQKDLFFRPLTNCIEQHPWLSVVVGDKHSEKSYFERVKTVDLERHISIHAAVPSQTDNSAIEDLLAANLDKPFPGDAPPWTIIVLPLQTGQYFVALSFSHTIGDGITGPSFHRTFLAALQEGNKDPVSSIVQIPATVLPAPFDTPERLPISWLFLLKPVFSVLLPNFISRLLGLRASASSTDAGSWTATHTFFDEKLGARTKVKMIEFDLSAVEKALQASRKHDAKLTGVMLQLITRALATHLNDPSVTNIVSQTAINLRKAAGIPQYEMGECVSGCYVIHAVQPSSVDTTGSLSEEEWAAARDTTEKLSLASAQLQDQPIGLLRYVPSIRGWLHGQIGRERDCSVEVSNIGTLDGRGNDTSSNDVKIIKVIFAQPGHVAGPPICFNIASVQGGSLVCTATWPTGSLNLGGRSEEDFVQKVCQAIKDDFDSLT